MPFATAVSLRAGAPVGAGRRASVRSAPARRAGRAPAFVPRASGESQEGAGEEKKQGFWKKLAKDLDLGPAGFETGGNYTGAQKSTVSDALDFGLVRSEEDYNAIEDAKQYVDGELGVKMTDEQAAALRRKVGGTYSDFMKDWVEPEGDCIDDGIIFVDGESGKDMSTSNITYLPVLLLIVCLVFFATYVVVTST